MERVEHNVKEEARSKVVNIGMDVHKTKWQLTVRKEGEEVFQATMPPSYGALGRFLKRYNGCKIRVAYEAGPSGFWLHDRLMEDGIETIVTPPSLIPVESGNRVKTDRRDSRKLCRLLESGMLKRVHVLSEKQRADREIVRTRRQLIEHRADIQRQIKSKLLFHGLNSTGTESERWSGEFISWLRNSQYRHEGVKEAIGALLDAMEALSVQIKRLDERIAEMARSEEYRSRVEVLETIPGVGRLSAMDILMELQEVERFSTAENLYSYLGLTPSEYSTGESVRRGQITHQGNRRVRTALVESCWHLIRRDQAMRSRYEKIKAKRGGKRAIVAVARHLSGVIRSMLITGEVYRLTPVTVK